MTTTNKIAIALGAIIVIALLLPFAMRSSQHPASPTAGAPTIAIKPPAPTTIRPRLHVGLYLSKMTGDQIGGYSCQIVGELSRGGFDLVPILEQGTESEQAITNLLKQWFPQKPIVNAADAAALKKLDVIVAPRIWMIPDDARAAIEAAVTNGTGLLARNGVGCMDPGNGPDISRLSGFEESQFGYNAHPMDCEVIGTHPILGKLSGQVGQIVKITPNGTWGIPGAQLVPLIRVKDMEAFREFFKSGGDDWTFYPLYTAQLGKGRIVGCQFPAWSPMPKDLMVATGSEFNIRAVQWLAHQLDGPVSSTIHPMAASTSQPATQAVQ